MKIVGEKDALAEIVQSVLRVVAGRATLPVLGGVRITAERDEVEFAGTDLEVSLVIRGKFGVSEQGQAVVPGRLFGEILRSLPAGKVTIGGSDQGEIRVESGRSEFSLNPLPVADFPEPPELEEAIETRVEASVLATALKQVARSASGDEARPILTGVLWGVEAGSLKLVATDSYRLAIGELGVKEGPAEAKVVVPARALLEFGRQLASAGKEEATIRMSESQAELRVGKVRLVTRLLEGEFPNWRQLIPEGYKNRLKVPREEFLAAVGRVGLVAQENTPLRLHLEDKVKVTAVESGVAEGWEELEGAEYSGEPMVPAFNPKFLADGLDAIDTDNVEIEFGDALKPALLRGEARQEFTYLVMPVRLPR